MKPPGRIAVDEKLESLREAVVAGTYRPDAEAVAAAILRHWSGEVIADAWVRSVDQEAADPDCGDQDPGC